MKRPDGVTIIAIADFLLAGLMTLGACAILMTMASIAATADGSGGEPAIAVGFISIGLLATVASVVVSLLAGWGLWKLKEWGRWLTIVLAIISLLGFPIGTLIGGLVIWYLLKPEVALAFGSGLPVVPPAVTWSPVMPGPFPGAMPTNSGAVPGSTVLTPVPPPDVPVLTPVPPPDATMPTGNGER